MASSKSTAPTVLLSGICASVTLALVFALTACAPKPHATSVVFIGNSITLVPAMPGTEWDHDSGMAASDADHDYAHIVARGLAIQQPVISNFADLERNPLDPINKIDTETPLREQIAARTRGIDTRTAVVVQLGDNVPMTSLAEFSAAYAALLDAVAARHSLICVSTFWERALKDEIIEKACEARGGRYVYIGDIFRDPANRDRLEGRQYRHAGIQQHPHDWSMARIGERVLSAVRG